MGGGILLPLLVITNIVWLCAFGFLLHTSGYDNKILSHLGLAEPTVSTDWTAVSWESCLEKLDIDSDVVFFGDSITRGSSFQDYFEDLTIVNLGLTGDTITKMQTRVGMISAVNPEKIFIMAGVNDLNNYQGDLNVIVERYEVLLAEIKEECPNVEIYIQSILPVNTDMRGNSISNENICELNGLIKEMAEQKGIIFIDLYELYAVDGVMPEELTKDGIHLYDEAYERWAEAISEYVYG